MKGPAVLVVHSLKRVRTLVFAVATVLGIFQVLLIFVARALHKTNAFAGLANLLPPFAREFLGPSATAFLSFGGLVCQGYFHPVVMGSVMAVAIAVATMPTSEIETRFMDLILSRPLPRHWMITRSIVVMAICTMGLLSLMVTTTWVGLHALAPKDAVWPAPSLLRALAVNLGFLMLAWSGIAMAIGAVSRRRGAAGAVVGLLALATFLLDYIARAWRPAQAVAWLSPFRYYSPLELMMGAPLEVKNLLVLAGIAVSGFALGYVFFRRRDLSH